jgi:glucose-6-phosphate isomerase
MNGQFEVEGLRISTGGNAQRMEEAIQKAKQDRLVERLWARDYTLWKPVHDEISNRLGWLDIAERMRPEIAALRSFTDKVKADGMDRVLLLGMGGSSLAPELFSKLFGSEAGLKLEVLDSTDPDAILEKEETHNPARTLYIVSSKSGGTVETSSFFKYFYGKAIEKLGKDEVGKHFVAITDPGSGLEKTGMQYEFREVYLADPNIGGRYSALSHFGLMPAALVGADLDRLLASAAGMAERCRIEDIASNPGAMLGLALGNLALNGRDKVTFILPDAKASFGDWVEQLLAESTGKEGKGILPVVREPALVDEYYGNDRVFASLDGTGHEPRIEIQWQENYEIGAQIFLWEFATAVAGYVMGINPFDQPNVELAKVQARSLVDEYKKTGKLPETKTEDLTWLTIAKFLKQAKPGDYVSLQAYAAPSIELTEAMQKLRSKISQQTKLATTFGYGPRFLHSTGQLHKGDGGNGLFIQFISEPINDLPIPNDAGKVDRDISFGVLKKAQALGDAQALHNAGRRLITFAIAGDITKAVNSW